MINLTLAIIYNNKMVQERENDGIAAKVVAIAILCICALIPSENTLYDYSVSLNENEVYKSNVDRSEVRRH